jgi:hypothetical protein
MVKGRDAENVHGCKISDLKETLMTLI